MFWMSLSPTHAYVFKNEVPLEGAKGTFAFKNVLRPVFWERKGAALRGPGSVYGLRLLGSRSVQH